MNKGRGRVIWDDANRDHIVLDHSERRITVDEVDQALADEWRQEVDDRKRGTVVTIGGTATGRILVVAWVPRGRDGMYPVHARAAGKKEVAIYVSR